MKINTQTAQLVCDIENIVGHKVCNANSCGDYRYSVSAIIKRIDGIDKRYYDFGYHIDIEDKFYDYGNLDEFINSMDYIFGINKLHIGKAICEVLTMLEQRYGIDFVQLESVQGNKKHN